MLLGAEAVGQKIGKGQSIVPVGPHQIHGKVILAELPHHLPADTAGRESAGEMAVFAAADGNGGKIPAAVGDGLEEGGTLGADRRGKGCVFDVAALIDGAVGTQQGRAHGKAGVGGDSVTVKSIRTLKYGS